MTVLEIPTAKRAQEKLWVTDAELIRLMGVPERTARATLALLDSKPSGFPQKQKLWGDRRYMPAVRDYFDQRYGANLSVQLNRRERA